MTAHLFLIRIVLGLVFSLCGIFLAINVSEAISTWRPQWSRKRIMLTIWAVASFASVFVLDAIMRRIQG